MELGEVRKLRNAWKKLLKLISLHRDFVKSFLKVAGGKVKGRDQVSGIDLDFLNTMHIKTSWPYLNLWMIPELIFNLCNTKPSKFQIESKKWKSVRTNYYFKPYCFNCITSIFVDLNRWKAFEAKSAFWCCVPSAQVHFRVILLQILVASSWDNKSSIFLLMFFEVRPDPLDTPSPSSQ